MKRKLLIPGVVVFEVCVEIYYLASFANGFKAPLLNLISQDPMTV